MSALQRSSFGMQAPEHMMDTSSTPMVTAMAMMQAQISIAHARPRDVAFIKSKLKECIEGLGDEAMYSFPRGNEIVSDLSVKAARELRNLWGNTIGGFRVVADSPDAATIEGYAWDLERNTFVPYQVTVRKMVQKSIYKDGKKVGSEWVRTEDERAIRELIARHGAILERNAFFNMVPHAIKESARDIAESWATKNEVTPDKLARLIQSFEGVKVSAEDLALFIGRPLMARDGTVNGQPCKALERSEFARLRSVFVAVRDGESWESFAAAGVYQRKKTDRPDDQKAPEAAAQGKASEPATEKAPEAAQQGKAPTPNWDELPAAVRSQISETTWAQSKMNAARTMEWYSTLVERGISLRDILFSIGITQEEAA